MFFPPELGSLVSNPPPPFLVIDIFIYKKYNMRNIKRLSEVDFNRIVKKVINEQSDEMDPNDLYRMYMREIESELRNIDDSYKTLRKLYEYIEMDENLDQDDKDDLLSGIEDHLP